MQNYLKYLKYALWVFVAIAVVAMVAYYNKQKRLSQSLLDSKNKELMQANLDLGRAKTDIVKQKEVQQAAMQDLDSKLKKEIKDREALITLYGKLQGELTVEKNKVKVVTQIVYRDGQTISIPEGKIFVKLDDGKYKEVESLTYTYEDFRINIAGDAVQKTLSYKLHQKFRGEFLETQLPGGAKNHYAKIFELDADGKDVAEIKLTSFNVLRAEDLPDHFSWFNPKLDLGVGIASNHSFSPVVVGELGVSLSSYGKTDDDITWRLFRIGTGISNKGFSLTFSPVLYNIGKVLPLISNTWVHVFMGGTFGGLPDVQMGVGLSVVL
jgi:hypothetical protein